MGSATMVNYPHLLSTLKIGPYELKNRVALAAMTRGRGGEKEVANDLLVEYYKQRAGAGLLLTEGTWVSSQGIGWYHVPGIYTAEQVEAWKPVTAAVHERGALFYAQIWHTGRASHSSFRPNAEDPRPVGPSPIAIDQKGHKFKFTPVGPIDYEVPRELTTEQVEQLPAVYQKAALNAIEAGFDGVEIHSANGYLLDEFLQSHTNQRTDKYGGSLENRFRLVKEVIEAVLEVLPPHKVGIKISPNGGFNDMGTKDFRESFLYFASEINKYKLGFLEFMNSLTFGWHELGEALTLDDFRTVYDGVIMANCGYTGETAEADIAAGKCDLVSFGRMFISNPDLPERFEKGVPLVEGFDMENCYATWEKDPGATGYTSYPTAT